MILKTIKWPDGKSRETVIAHKDELIHLMDAGKKGPYANKIFVGYGKSSSYPVSLAAVTLDHIAVCLLSGTSAGELSWDAHELDPILCGSGHLRLKDFMKGVKKETHIFMSFEDWVVHIGRVDCKLPDRSDWDLVDLEHTFILEGEPVENRSAAYAKRNVNFGIADRYKSGAVPLPDVWEVFSPKLDNYCEVGVVHVRGEILTKLASTVDICGGRVKLEFIRLKSNEIIASIYGYDGTTWLHAFSEVKVG